ncbi:Fic family protein [Deltaproteobacteria bacterium PRO3]|nr:Fic family protein [Deltaproteobacteria bacterium PRO3]
MIRKTGQYDRAAVGGETVAVFTPYPLPPADPKLSVDEQAQRLLIHAEQKLAGLDLASQMVPSLDWFLYAYVRKEAVTSSQIEGTQATLIDLLSFEANDHLEKSENPDIEEVCNYLEAVNYARRQLADKKGLPISMRLLNEAHKRLMKGARGGNKSPGEIRQSQNWIGGSRPGNAVFVPPPPTKLPRLLTDLEKYIHSDDKLPPLIRIGLIHVQFETIHPYLDGNGRIGRLLIALLLEYWGFLKAPLLYLSLYFKRHRQEYYRLLGDVRTQGHWEAWTKFFLTGVMEIAEEATSLAKDLFSLVTKDRARVLRETSSTVFTLRLFELLPTHPILTTAQAVKLLDTSKPTALKAIGTLEKLKILSESTGRKRGRFFGYTAYLNKLRAGTELGEEPEN